MAPGETTAEEGSPSDAEGGLGRPTFRNIHGMSNDDHARSDNRGVQVIFEVTKSNTTPNIGDSAVHQPTIDDGWGQARPAFADLQHGGTRKKHER